MSKSVIVGTDTVNAALITRCNSNFTELYNLLAGVTSPTLLTPTIASFVNAGHTHANAANGGATLTAPTISAPTITGVSTIAVEAWTDFSPSSGWTAVTQCSYMIDPMGFVHLKGNITSAGAETDPAYTIAADYRPAQNSSFLTSWRSGYGGTFTIIGTDGHIHSGYSSVSHAVTLDGIVYKAA